MKKVLVIVGIIGVIGLIMVIRRKEVNLMNPLGEGRKKKEMNKPLVIGFLPTWMIGKTRVYGSEIDELIFLGIEVTEEGKLVWDAQGKKINGEEYLKIKREIKRTGGKNILGIKLFEDEKLDKLLGDKESWERLIEELRVMVRVGGFGGINVDFEYQGSPIRILGDEFGGFLDKLNEANLGEISVDVFANTIIKGSIEQILGLVGAVDKIIVMAYDFHRPGVDYAGPVAPIRSAVGERNILEITERIVGLGLEKKKIILAYPLYGYEWKTESEEFGAQVKRGWYQMASWKRVKEMLKQTAFAKASATADRPAVKWDEESMSPWMSFKEDGEIHQIYYEDERSLRAKLELVRQTGLGGVGFWALGYEGEDEEVWREVRKVLSN